MDLNDLWNTLQATLLNDNDARRAAEKHLNEVSGATALRRAITKMWHNDDPTAAAVYAVEEKNAVRNSLITTAVAQTELPIINAFADIAKVIFRHDYPDRWSDLPAQLMTHLTSGSPHRVALTCVIFRQFCKVYDQNTRAAEAILNPLLDAVVPTLFTIARYIVSHDNSPMGAETLRHILKSVFSCTEFHLGSHPCFYRQEQFIAWCGLANDVLSKHLPDPALGETGEPAGQPTAPDARERWCWWRAKKWAIKLFHRIADRYGQPLLERKEATLAASTVMNKHIAPEVAKTVLGMLYDWRQKGRWVSSRFLLYGLHFLQTCVDFASCWKGVLEPAMEFLLPQVVLHLFRMTEEEVESLIHDPHEYVRASANPMAAHLSPRHSAELLMWAATKVRRKTLSPILDGMIAGGLQSCAAAAATVPPTADPLAKEALLYMIQMNRNYLCGSKKRAGFVEGMLATHVTPELANPHPALRARAASVWGAYISSVDFKAPATVQAAVDGLLRQLDDRSLAVRLVAGGVLTFFLRHSEVARAMIQPHLVLLLERLFGMLDELGVDEVVGTVNEVILAYSEQIPELAVSMVGQLMTVFRAVLTDKDDEDAEAADEASLAGEGALQAIRSVVDALMESKRKDVLLAVVEQLWPMLAHLFVEEGPALEFLDVSFDTFGDLLVALSGDTGAPTDPTNTVPSNPAVWRTYAAMMHTYTNAAIDYTSHMLYPLDCIMSYAPSRLACGVDPDTGADNAGLLCSAAAFVESKSDERERGYLTRAMVGLLHHCRGLVDRLVPGIAALYAKAVCTGHTQMLRSQAGAVLGCCLAYSVPLTFAGLEGTAAGASAAVFAALYDAVAGGYFKKSLDVKLTLMGLACLLGTPLASLPPGMADITPQTLAAIAALEVRYEELLASEAEERELAREADEGSDEDDDDEADLAAALRGGEDEEEGDEDEDAGGVGGPGGDYVHEDDKAYKDMLHRKEEEEAAKAAAAAAGGEGAGAKPAARTALPSGDEDFEEAPPEHTPIDHLNHRLWLADAFAFLSSQPSAAAYQASTHAEVQRVLFSVVERANAERAAGQARGELGPAPPRDPAVVAAEVAAAAAAATAAAAAGASGKVRR